MQKQHLQLQQNISTQYRAGSLPNVNQMVTNSNVDLQVRLFTMLTHRTCLPFVCLSSICLTTQTKSHIIYELLSFVVECISTFG